MTNTEERWIAATDGSAINNPGPGGWAWVILFPDKTTEHRIGSAVKTTNNVMELTAVVKLLQRVPREQRLEVRLDSSYVLNSVTRWIPGWKRNNWRKADGAPVKNADIMKKLDELVAGRDINFVKVKAHQKTGGDPLNEFVDAKANAQARKQKENADKRRERKRGAGFGGPDGWGPID